MKFGIVMLLNNKKLKPFLIEKFGNSKLIFIERVVDYSKKYFNHEWYDEKLYGKKIVVSSETYIYENNNFYNISFRS